MASPGDTYDVVIVGGGPAGCAAAIAAGREKLRALIIERDDAPRPGPCAGWLGPPAERVCVDCGVDVAALGVEFAGLRLRSWDFKHTVAVSEPELRGRVVDPVALSEALLKAARKQGADVMAGTTVTGLQLGENRASLRLSSGQTVACGVVLIADGAASPTAGLTHLTAARQLSDAGSCALAVFETPEASSGLDLVLGSGRGLKLATIARRGTEIRAMLCTTDDSAPGTVQLEALLAAARAAGAIPDAAAIPDRVHCLAGVALEMESHVGKRCVLIGDAGGFASAFSNESLYPALRSGWLAAQTVARAIGAPVLQDELASFGAAWRADLAGYLQMPNTDLGLLMPMVFSNPQMSARVARAFLLGQAL